MVKFSPLLSIENVPKNGIIIRTLVVLITGIAGLGSVVVGGLFKRVEA